jgi:hypothetical protein
MYIDNFLRVANSSRITASGVAGANPSDIIDLRANNDLGMGNAVRLHVAVHQNLRTETASNAVTNINIQLVGATASGGLGATVLGQLHAFATASISTNRPIIVEINPKVRSAGYQYLFALVSFDANFTTSTGSASGFVYTADLVMDRQDNRDYYPSGFSLT